MLVTYRDLVFAIAFLSSAIRADDNNNDNVDNSIVGDDNDSDLMSASYLVDFKKIPGLENSNDIDSIPIMFAGHIAMFDEIKLQNDQIPKDLGYFFWKFVDRKTIDKDYERPLIFWFNGGPGCSSMDGALVESGPLRISKEGKAYLNSGSWHTRGDLVYIDQPMGTGFSSLTESNIKSQLFEKDLNSVSERLLEFLQKYFEIFPDDINRDIILAGESYAGQYIPYFAHHIQEYNKKIESSDNKINLISLLIGNGWIDPTTQSLSYLPFAMENNLVDRTDPSFKELLTAHEDCQKKINAVDDTSVPFEYGECQKIIDKLLSITSNTNAQTQRDKESSCINVYNYELKDSYPSCGMNWPVDISNVEKFFSHETVKKALHINKDWVSNWKECKLEVDKNLFNENVKPSVTLLPSLLESGLNIILFNGDKDLICNNKGILDTIDNMKWGGSNGFTNDMEEYDWYYRNSTTSEDEQVGYVKYDKNLTFISIFNASHMVPYDKSDISRGIVDISLNNVLFNEINKRNALISGDKPFKEVDNEDVNDNNEKEDEENASENENSEDEHGDSDNEENENSDDEHDSDNEENEDSDEDDEGKGDDYNEDETQKEEKSEEDEVKFNTGLAIFLLSALATILVGAKYHKLIMDKINYLINYHSYSSLNKNKTVTWADDLEGGISLEEAPDGEFDIDYNDEGDDQENSSPNNDSNKNTKADRDSFELEDMS